MTTRIGIFLFPKITQLVRLLVAGICGPFGPGAEIAESGGYPRDKSVEPALAEWCSISRVMYTGCCASLENPQPR